MTTHMLLVAHGSRREKSNHEVKILSSKLGFLATDYASVSYAFLELAEPGIPDALRKLIHSGAEKIVVVPYFLAAGRHVVDDIPAEVESVRKDHPDVKIVTVPHLGSMDGIPRLLLQLAGLAH